MKSSFLKNMLIFAAAIGLVAAPKIAKAMSETCDLQRQQANHLIRVVQQGLLNYRRLESLKPQQYPPDQIHRAKVAALSIIKQYRDNALVQENDLANVCNVGSTEKTFRGLEKAFDLLNVQLAMSEIHRHHPTWR